MTFGMFGALNGCVRALWRSGEGFHTTDGVEKVPDRCAVVRWL